MSPGVATGGRWLGLVVLAAVVTANTAISVKGYCQVDQLVGAGWNGTEAPLRYVRQAFSTALSADGTTAALGGPYDADGVGAVWVFSRSADSGRWAQVGEKLVGAGCRACRFGWSVALSGDGRTLGVGSPGRAGTVGSAWVYTRTPGGAFEQQGAELLGLGGAAAFHAASIALSASGDTLAVGANGTTAVYTRESAVWTRSGAPLVGAGPDADAQGVHTVAIDADGATVAVGAPDSADGTGAAYVFSRSAGGAWRQQGSPLVGAGGVGRGAFAHAIALSGDGRVLAVGAPYDGGNAGAAWLFRRERGAWSQQGGKLVGGAAGYKPRWASSLALSKDGGVLAVGAEFDGPGSAWVYTRGERGYAQLGGKLSQAKYSSQGASIALSGAGDVLLVGAPEAFDVPSRTFLGAAWVYQMSTPCRDLSPASKADSRDVLAGLISAGIQPHLLSLDASVDGPISFGIEPLDLDAQNQGIVKIPVALGSVGIYVNAGTVTPQSLTAKQLCSIFGGNATWGQVEPGLGATAVTVVAREDELSASPRGGTRILVERLAKMCGKAVASRFSASVLVTGTSGMMEAVGKTHGAVGYAMCGAAGVGAREVPLATAAGAAVGCRAADYAALGLAAFPLAYELYASARADATAGTPEQRAEGVLAKRALAHLTTPALQAALPAWFYFPLPSSRLSMACKAINALKTQPLVADVKCPQPVADLRGALRPRQQANSGELQLREAGDGRSHMKG